MLKVAFIGSGGRSVCYARTYGECEDVKVAAVADPDEGHYHAMIDKSGLVDRPAYYADWTQLLQRHDDLDGVVIGTPNYLHADPAIECVRRGLPVALEKPLATTREDCERILDAIDRYDGRVLLGFVLRSTPFYSRIKELIDSGAIGRVLSIQADELVGLNVSSVMFRSFWRRFKETSGGSLLEKCCHDMDVLNWIVGALPRSINSYGRRTLFTPDPALPEQCEACPQADRCLYYKQPVRSEQEDAGETTLHQFVREENSCIYNIDKDNMDVQAVQIEYRNGVPANFMMNYNVLGPRSGRNFMAVGSDGNIWGNMHQHEVFVYRNLEREAVRYDTRGDGSGHGGGDRSHALLLRRMMQEPEFLPEQDAAAGYLSAVMAFAADRSREEGRRIDLEFDSRGRLNAE